MGGFNSIPEKDGTPGSSRRESKGYNFGAFAEKIEDSLRKQESESYSSDEDAEKFKAAVQANAMARMSEKKIYTKLASEATKPRKTTIDLEGMLTKTQSAIESVPENAIKKGYYAKLGIERSPTVNSSVRYYNPLSSSQRDNTKKPNKESVGEHFSVSMKKTLSSKNLTCDELEIEDDKIKKYNSDVNEQAKNEESKQFGDSEACEDSKFLESEDDPFFAPKAMVKRSNTVEEGSKLDPGDGKEYIETSFTTKDSGNWRLDLVKNSKMARSGDRIRQDLLSKLTYQKIWLTPSQKPSTHQTVFIYDWDDTLLCTSFLNPTGYYDESLEIPEVAKKHLEKLEKAVEKVLTESVKHGQTYIVTNAAEGWVQFSSKKYMPSVYEALKKVEVISARSLYEGLYPGDSYEWKIQAFTKIQKELESSLITNIIACGDSRIEMEAARHIAKLFNTAFIKTVKFKETPTPEELIKQLNLVIQKLDHISTAPRNLTIRLERKNK